VLRVRYHHEEPKTIWEGTDAFVNYCINHLRPIRSRGGRLYCNTKTVDTVRLKRLR
jgi:hypothetical protein